MNSKLIPVVLSGGSGTRLWPVSREKFPKQFVKIFNDSLHNMTLKRLKKINNPWVITNEKFKILTITDFHKNNIPVSQILLEPIGKNTAAAIALLCAVFSKKNLSDNTVGVFSADHLIENEESFFSAVDRAYEQAQKSKLVTLGIKPTFAATGYGYIQVLNGKVQKFHEKPSMEIAEQFFKSGQYYWNAGIFVFKVQNMIELLQSYQPQMWQLFLNLKEDFSNVKEIYEKVQSISIDYAILEKISPQDLSCIDCDIGWSDVGSWDAISQIERTNATKIYQSIQSSLVLNNAKNNFVHSNQQKIYAFSDIDDLVVIDTRDALLITKKNKSENVKHIVEKLKASKSRTTSEHLFEERPWGEFEVLKDDEHFKSKIIKVLPDEQLSYQSHKHREEHWIITKGHGEVTLNDSVVAVKKGDYIHIPLGAKHRIKNTGSSVLEFIEVQLGQSFSEEDIIRFSDVYQRV